MAWLSNLKAYYFLLSGTSKHIIFCFIYIAHVISRWDVIKQRKTNLIHQLLCWRASVDQWHNYNYQSIEMRRLTWPSGQHTFANVGQKNDRLQNNRFIHAEALLSQEIQNERATGYCVQSLWHTRNGEFTVNMAVNSVYDFTMDTLERKAAPLSNFRGKVLLIINVATFWGSTIEEVQ